MLEAEDQCKLAKWTRINKTLCICCSLTNELLVSFLAFDRNSNGFVVLVEGTPTWDFVASTHQTIPTHQDGFDRRGIFNPVLRRPIIDNEIQRRILATFPLD